VYCACGLEAAERGQIIGLVRGDIDWVADELAARAVTKAANANSAAPQAAKPAA